MAKTGRFLTLDLLRGYFVFSLIIIHLRLWPNLLMAISGGSKLWVSVGIGFFCVSGFLFGYINRELWKDSPQTTTLNAFNRAKALYFWSLFTTFVFTIWGNLLSVEYQKAAMWVLTRDNLAQFIWKTVSLQYTYGWTDYLNFYVIYVFFAPLFFFIIEKFSWRIGVAACFVLYAFHNLSPYFGYQLVFFLSLATGYNFELLAKKWRQLSIYKKNIILRSTNIIFWATLMASIFSVHYLERFVYTFFGHGVLADYIVHKNHVLNLYFEKQSVAIGRVILWPFWFYGFYRIFEKFALFFEKLWNGFFLYIGQNPFKVYIIHAFIIFPAPYFIHLFSIDTYWERTIFTAVVVWIVYYTSIKLKNIKI